MIMKNMAATATDHTKPFRKGVSPCGRGSSLASFLKGFVILDSGMLAGVSPAFYDRTLIVNATRVLFWLVGGTESSPKV